MTFTFRAGSTMKSYNCSFVTFRIISTIVIFCSIFDKSDGQKLSAKATNYGLAKLVLFQGLTRHEVIGKNCPVGISFVQPQRFSCACVNGIWAFYDTMCSTPLAVVGGNNYCFQMPENYIQQITVISNPMRALDNFLTVFVGERESIRTKVYRNIHIPLNGTDNLLTLNSSWTIKNPEGTDSICLNSKSPLRTPDSDINNYTDSINLKYCNFMNISALMPRIGSMLKGCNDSTFNVYPSECQPIMSANDQSLCTSSSVLEDYTASLQLEVNSLDGSTSNDRAFKRKWHHSTTIPTSSSTTTTTTTAATITPRTYRKITNTSTIRTTTLPNTPKPLTTTVTTMDSDEMNLMPIPSINMLLEELFTNEQEIDTNDIHVITGRNLDAGAIIMNAEEMISKMNGEWTRIEQFLIPKEIKSETQVMNQIWKYEKMNIQKSLGLLPNEPNTGNPLVKSNMYALLEISKEILSKICPLVTKEYLDMALDSFLTVQQKNYRWREPFIDVGDFNRVYASLTACSSRAKLYNFSSGVDCFKRNPDKVVNGTDANGQPSWVSTQGNFIPNEFVSKGLEPIIETVWKMFVSTHSYCFNDFSEFYNDHHKYTTSVIAAFVGGINKLWIDHKDQVIDQEYGGVIGPAEAMLADLDKCAAATRMTTGYMFPLSRPTAASDNRRTVQVKLSNDVTEEPLPDKTDTDQPQPSNVDNSNAKRRRRRAAVEKILLQLKTDAWKKNRKILNGLGYCLKKYDEPRVHLGQDCDE